MNQKAYYRTKDGQSDYLFSFEEQRNGTWLAFILRQPPYNGRNTGSHPTHRLRKVGRDYVCWNSRLGSQDEARQIAALWADATQKYIKNGTRF